MFREYPRPIARMKKLILFSAVLFGTAVASQADIYFDIGFRLPTPPILFPGRVIVSHLAPVYVVPRHCEPPRVFYAPAPVVYLPAPQYHSHPSKKQHKHKGCDGRYGKSAHRGAWDDRGGHHK